MPGDKRQRLVIAGLVVAILVLILWVPFGRATSDRFEKPLITSPAEYDQYLKEAEKLSLATLQDLDNGLQITAQDRDNLKRAADTPRFGAAVRSTIGRQRKSCPVNETVVYRSKNRIAQNMPDLYGGTAIALLWLKFWNPAARTKNEHCFASSRDSSAQSNAASSAVSGGHDHVA